MKGAGTAADRQTELAIFTAWTIARMTTYGEPKQEPLGKWLDRMTPHKAKPKRQSAAEMIAALRAIKSSVRH